MGSDLTPYSPRLLLQWDDDAPGASHRAIDGTLVFADVSGFTRLSERLARSGGRAGAEEMGSVVDRLFDELLTAAALRGGEMLKYGGDAALLFFRGEHHAARAAAGAADMQRRLREVGRIETQAGVVRLRMSVGMNSGSFDLFKVGRVHEELIIAGPATTETARMEAAADPGEILVSASTAALLDDRDLGAEKAGGRLLRRAPDAPVLPVVRLEPSPRAGRFVCSRLAQHLDGGVDPDHRLATVAFIHLMDVDGMLLDVGPTLVASRLDATMTVVQEALDDLGVFFLATDMAADGAKVMAAAGAPLAGEDEERRMLLALRRIIDADTPLRVRAGVNRGHVFAASVGPHYRKTFTCIGDVVNTSARVQAKAGPGEVLALAPVLEHARGRFATTVLAPFAAKGKTEPLVPQRVDGFEGDDDAPVSMLPLVGRDVELECLVAAADTARGGSGSLVELVGDMGSGKSRLVEELLLRVPDMRAIVVPCEPYQQATPFHPFTRVLQRLVVGDETGDRAAALRHTVSVRVPHLAPWIPLIAGVLDVAVPDTDATRSLEPRFRMERTAAATGELIKALLPEPTVLVFEDIHWLDDASAVLLSELELVATGSPWVVCVTRRDEPSPFTRSRPESSLVHLTALADDDMHQLVSLATTEAPMPPHRRSAIVQRAGGNPLFLTELLQHGVDSDVLPDSVEAVMAAQIDRLDPAARKLLRRAAVLGSRFDIDMLAALADDASLDRASAASVSRRVNAFLVPDGTRRLRFRHQLIRDVAYQSLPFRERRALHLRAGDAIERAPGHDDCERASILSLHFLHAQEFERCWHHARIAGDRACEKYANVEAVELLERALSAAKVVAGVADEELASTWEKLATQQEYLGSIPAVKIALRNARRLCAPRPVDVARLCAKEARLRERQADSNGIIRWVRRGLHVLDGLDGQPERVERAFLLVLYAWAKNHQGRPKEARRWATLGLEEAERADNRSAIASANLALDGAEVALGNPSDPARARRALAIYEELGLVFEQAVVLNNLGTYAHHQSRWTEALDLYARGRDALVRVGNLVEAAYGTFNIAEVLIDQGRLDEAEPLLDDVEALWRSVDHVLGCCYVEGLRGRLALQRAQPERALERFTSVRATFERAGLATFVLDADAYVAECLLRLGRVDDARAITERGVAQDRAAGGTSVAPALHRIRASCVATTDLDAALDAMHESLRIARARSAVRDVVLALDGIGALLRLGELPIDPSLATERDRLVGDLGIVEVPSPAIPDANQRARRRRPVTAPAGG